MNDDFNPFKVGPVGGGGGRGRAQGAPGATASYRAPDPFSSMASNDVFADDSITSASSNVSSSLLTSTGQPLLYTDASAIGAIGGSRDRPPSVAVNITSSQTPPPPAPPQQAAETTKGCCWFLTPAVLQPHFDVDSVDVRDRLLYSVFPFKRSQKFLELTNTRNDLYGPWWLSTTLIFLVGVVSNVVSWIEFVPPSSDPSAKWAYDLTKVTYAAAIVYGYTFGAPLLLYFLAKYWGFSIRMAQLFCIYGYSLTAITLTAPFCIPASLFSLQWINWILIGVATALSSSFLVLDLWPEFKASDQVKAVTAIGTVLGAHIAFSVGLKILFF